MDISIIIVNYNVTNDVINCINSIKDTLKGAEYEIFVADNNSPDRSIENIGSLSDKVKFIKLPDNRGFGFANNAAAFKAKGDFLLFSNPDIIFTKNSINELYEFVSSNSNTACAGPLIIRPDESIQYYYTFFPTPYSRFMQEFGFYETAKKMKERKFSFLDQNIAGKSPFKVDWVLGACMMIPRKLFIDIGGFDDSFFLYEEEVDLLYRLKLKGFDTYFLPGTKVIHNHNTSTSSLGFAFIRYHGFRSIIIYSNKHNKGLSRLFSKLMLTIGINLRFIRGLIFRKYRLGNIKSHFMLFYDLLKLNWLNLTDLERTHNHFNITLNAVKINSSSHTD